MERGWTKRQNPQLQHQGAAHEAVHVQRGPRLRHLRRPQSLGLTTWTKIFRSEAKAAGRVGARSFLSGLHQDTGAV